MTVPLYVLDMAELAPDQIVRLEPGRVVVLDQRRLPDEEVELVVRLGGGGRGGDPDARRPRRAGDRRSRRVRLRARRRAGGGPRRRRTPSCAGRARRQSTSPGRSTEMRATTRAREHARADPPGRGRALPCDGRATPRRSSTGTVGVLTHCNTGGLATGGYGTALGAIRAAWEQGLVERVWVDETRPLLQGARLTAWELEQLGIPYSVIADSAAASLNGAGEVDCVLTGADRIAANGDTANKIGTYGLAVLARHHEIPFYVVAPTSTVDHATPTGAEIPIEERDAGRGDDAVSRVQSGLRRHAGRARRGHRHRARRPPCRPTRRVLAHEVARPRRGLRDAALPADARPREAAAPDRRPADGRLACSRPRARSASTSATSSRTRSSRDQFRDWAEARDVTVIDDGTTSEEDRLGAIGDIGHVIERAGDRRRPASWSPATTSSRRRSGTSARLAPRAERRRCSRSTTSAISTLIRGRYNVDRDRRGRRA